MALELKQRFKKREFSLGVWQNMAHPAISEILAKSGYDWIVLDNEHSMFSFDQLGTLIPIIQGSGAKALLRLSHNDPSEIRKTLDAGLDGVMCPMINTEEDAKALLDQCKYPPMGKRSYGLYRAQGFGAQSADYFAHANDRTSVIIQIEHIEGVRNIDAILQVPGIDGVLTGPYDLSGSLNIPGQLTHPDVIKAEKEVIAACQRHDISCGAHLVHPEGDAIQKKLDLGYTFLALGTDFGFILEGAKKAHAELRQRLKK
jgi:2-dehydro-3-deoxyglucarate aldolase